ncbi:MAG: thioredoxin family protein [Christensenellales bacterium]
MKKITENEAAVLGQGKVIVDFYADWCGPCMYMKPFYEEAEKDLNGVGITCYEVNVDECESLAMKNKINFIPCVIFFDNGKEIDRFTGGRDKEGIVEFAMKNVNK